MLLRFRTVLAVLLVGLFFGAGARAGTLTIQTNVLGPVPDLLGYNCGHFYPGSNTKEWWRYAGVTCARMFISASEIEPTSSISGAAALAGVTNQASFLSARASMHTNQFNPNFINWVAISNNYANHTLTGVNTIRIDFAMTALRALGIQPCAQISATTGAFPLTSTTDWPGIWGIWHHYYAQAFYLARVYDVTRYQIYNEPNNVSTNFTVANLLQRTQVASDAIQAAIADVNSLYGKSLAPLILGPTLAGNAISAYPTWGVVLVTNRHVNFLNQSDPNFLLFQKYDYHQYGSAPSGFGGNLASLNALLAGDMAPEPRFKTTITEFDTRTAASFDSVTNTPDSPVEYAKLGGICVELMSNLCSELYLFKFSQVDYAGNYPVEKNALHYVDNDNSPYNIGGLTKGGEAYRLFNKAFAAGRTRLNVNEDVDASVLETAASYDPATQRYYLYSANNTGSPVSANIDLTALNLAAGSRVLLEEVSETNYGGAILWTNVPANSVLTLSQSAWSVWLLTIPSRAQQAEQIVANTGDAEVRDGANRLLNFGAAATMTAQNDPANTANRRVSFMKFHLPVANLTNIELAALSFQAVCATTNSVAQAHVYFLTNTTWSPATITWATAPNLKQNIAAGNLITNDVTLGIGTNASIIGQLVVTSTNFSEKLIDLTGFLRGQTNTDFSVLIVQDPRWNLTLPSLATGDTQPDGIQIKTMEGGNGPRLRLVLASTNLVIASNDNYTLSANHSLAVPAPGVLANDSNALGAMLVNGVAYGNLSFNSDGSFSYMPVPNFIGADSFTYRATNVAGVPSIATVNLVVQSPAYYTNLPVAIDAFVRGGSFADQDQDEATLAYILVKYSTSLDTSRKAYFQFNLAGLNVVPGTQAVLTVSFNQTFKQNIRLWSLNQPYTNFNSTITWDAAQANDTNSNSMLTTGPVTASPIGVITNIPTSGSSPQSFVIPQLASLILSNRATFAMSADTNGTFLNDAGGLRIVPGSATLQVLVLPPPVPPPLVTAINTGTNGSLQINYSGTANATFLVQATTNLTGGVWTTISTNVADASGLWSFTDPRTNNLSRRFYRAVSP